MKYSTKDIPKIKPFKSISFPAYYKIELKNGIPVYIIHSDEYDVMKAEISFKAGRVFESQQGVARACANQLKEGTKSFSSEKIAHTIDFYGSSLNTMGGMDFARVELYSLNKHLENLLPYLTEILTLPNFSEGELNNYIHVNARRLAIDLAKNDILAYRALTEALFGKDHAYGYNSDEETIKNLNIGNLHKHFDDNIGIGPQSIILAGRIDPGTIKLIENSLGGIPYRKDLKKPVLPSEASSEQRIRLTGQQKYQTSIRLGRKIFDRSHPDYPGIYVLNTILGGFFGSRLMTNLREEKGLTYDIYSTLDMLWLDGYLMIGAEVDNENVALTLSEIHKEFDLLKAELVPDDELILVKNYINGNLLNLMNGPFNSVELLRLVANHAQSEEFFKYFMLQIQNIDSFTLRELARKYLNKDDFFEVIVGK
jgi:zinc protease